MNTYQSLFIGNNLSQTMQSIHDAKPPPDMLFLRDIFAGLSMLSIDSMSDFIRKFISPVPPPHRVGGSVMVTNLKYGSEPWSKKQNWSKTWACIEFAIGITSSWHTYIINSLGLSCLVGLHSECDEAVGWSSLNRPGVNTITHTTILNINNIQGSLNQ